MKHTFRFGIACIIALGAIAATSSTTQASAQVLPVVGGPNGFVFGVFSPTDALAVRDGGANQVHAELRYGLPIDIPLSPTRTVISISADYGDRNGNHSTIVPVTIGEYFGLNGKSPFAPLSTYAGVGTGAYLINESNTPVAERIGGYGVLGYNIALGFFVEGKYQVVAHGNGFAFGVGWRF